MRNYLAIITVVSIFSTACQPIQSGALKFAGQIDSLSSALAAEPAQKSPIEVESLIEDPVAEPTPVPAPTPDTSEEPVPAPTEAPAPIPTPTEEPTPIPTHTPVSTYTNQLPVPELKDEEYGTLTSSIYYTPEIDLATAKACDPDKNPEVNIEDKDGNALVVLCRNNFKMCQMEGSCKIKDKDGNAFAITVVKTVGDKTIFIRTNLKRCPYGQGVSSICLDPFFTIAADMKYYKTGDVIFVKEVRGSVLPDGTLHSGYFIVRDMGDKIRGAHRFDFFTGGFVLGNQANTFTRLGLSGSKHFKYVVIAGDTAKRFRSYRGFKALQ